MNLYESPVLRAVTGAVIRPGGFALTDRGLARCRLRAGARVLDIGCGAGVDALVASKVVGPSGYVLGLDITPEMIRRAEVNKKEIGVENVVFQLDRVQDLTGIEASFDVVISNGAFSTIHFFITICIYIRFWMIWASGKARIT
jgi:cyclopropane fatty-acyl-phospholipid synthase-like methyltransferase